jgi:hypothetical protein
MRSCNTADFKNVALNLDWSIQQQTQSKLHEDVGPLTLQGLNNVQKFFVSRRQQTVSFHYQHK